MLSVLFDLDDTLIINNAEHFTRVYLGLLGKHLQHLVEPQKMIQALMDGTRQMVAKIEIAGTLESAFDREFYPQIGLPKETLWNTLFDFYQNVFPVLKTETTFRPEAVTLVQQCLANGWKVAVATNPLFPEIAVHHRLNWAGLDSDRFPFAAITSYETYHFAKPQSAYFIEVADRIAAFDHSVVMVGNDLENDILPAGKAGLRVFWITDSDEALPACMPSGSKRGKFEEIYPWLRQIEHNRSHLKNHSPSALLAALRGGAAAIDAIASELSLSKWTMRPASNEWCLTEILCHLRDLDREVNMLRINTILQETEPFIAGIETERWAVERGYLQQDGPQALREFINARQAIIDLLENTASNDWDRIIRHSIFGPTSLRELVSFIVAHDNNHIRQINKLET